MAKTQSSRVPGDTEETHVRMSFGEHLEELRKRMFYAAVGAVIAMGACMYCTTRIIQFLIKPYHDALQKGGYSAVWLNTGPTELVLSYLSIGFKAGLVLAAPWIIYQLWLFIGAGLYQKERRVIYKYLGPSMFLFFVGVAFFYFIVLPLTLKFFVEFSHATWVGLPQPAAMRPATVPATESATLPATTGMAIPMLDRDPSLPEHPEGSSEIWYNTTEGRLKIRTGSLVIVPMTTPEDSQYLQLPKLDEYLHFVLFTALVFGACFELPMVMLVVAQMGFVKVKTYGKIRKYAYFGISIAAAVLAPSADLMSMMSLMVPLVGLYEIGIIVSMILVKKQPDEPAEEEPQEPESA